MIARAAALFAIAVAGRAQNNSVPGITASLSDAALQYVLEAALPVISAAVDGFDIPLITFSADSFNISASNIVCGDFAVSSGSVMMQQGVGIFVLLDGIDLSCAGDWAFFQETIHIPYGSGGVNISVTASNAQLSLDVKDSQGIGGPAVVSANNVALTIGNVDLTFTGSNWDIILNLIKPVLVDAISTALTDAFAGAIDTLVNVDANALLAALGTALPLPLPPPYNLLEARFGLTADPSFNLSFVGVPLQGDVVSTNNPQSPPLPPPALPPFVPADAGSFLQVQLSSYTPLSAVYALLNEDLLTWLLPPSALPAGFNSTAAYALIAPGFPQAFPYGQVWLYLLVPDMPTLAVDPVGGITGSAPLLMGFNTNTTSWNNDTTNAFLLQLDVGLGFNASIASNASTGAAALHVHVAYAGANITVGSTNVGPVDVGLLQALVDLLLDVVLVPAIDAVLAGGLPLPSLPGLQLVGPQLLLGQGYITLATNFSFAAAGVR